MALENQPNSNLRPQAPGFDKDPPDVGTVNPGYPHPPGVGSRGEGTRGAPFGASGRAVGGGADLWYAGDEEDGESTDEEADEPEQSPHDREDQPDWEKRAQDAMRFSTTYLDSNYRQKWDDSLRAFNNQHPGDSKYNSENFRKRSHLFVPVTRTVIRKNEAAACKAFFSNHDVASIRPLNEGDPKQVISAAVMKELVQYRTKHQLHWFQFLIGGLQDAQKQGACVANVEWCYQTRRNVNGKLVTSKDQPKALLVPLENMRFDPSASWMDPFNDSPYLIELVQMYVGDVRTKMARPDPKGRRWKEYSDAQIRAASGTDDSTRQARLGDQQDPAGENRSVSDYEVCWVQRHIHRWDGNDWHFWTLNDGKLLTDPELLEHVVFHGKRPYIIGFAVLETHKPLPVSVPELVKPLQDAINNLENTRSDNVLFALNKRAKVKRGTNVDTVAYLRNVPGGIVNVDNMEDLEIIETPDVTASSYQEEDRKRQAFDDLAGNFNPMQLHQAGAPREAQGTVRMLQGPASEMTEYMLQTYAITFVVEVLRHIVLLEQHYETDKKVLAIAGQKAKMLQKFGQDEVTDEMLEQELTTEVNVGMGSTDATAMLARLVYALRQFAEMAKLAPPGVNLAEVWKEIMALSGYQDGERFSTQGNQEMAKLEAINKQLTMMVQDLKRHKQDKEQGNILNFVAKREAIQAKERSEAAKHKGAIAHTYAQHLLDQDDALLAHALGGMQAEQQGAQQSQLSAQNAEQQQHASAAAPKPAA
jgi:hypothetical protein